MDNIGLIAAIFGISFAIFASVVVVVFLRVKRSFDAAGGIEGLQHMVNQEQVDHPSRAFPVVAPAGAVNASRLLVLALLLSLVLACGIGGFFQYRLFRAARLLEEEGVVTMATVVEKHIVEDDEDGETYYVTYTFVASSEIGKTETMRRKERVSYTLFVRVPETGQVEIIYAPSDPKVARITAQYEPGKVSFLPAIVVTIVALTDLLMLSWFYRRYQNASRLEFEGVPATVTVLDLFESSGSDSTTYFVAYALPDGQHIRHSVSQQIYDTLAVGDTIRVIYLLDDPRIFRPEWPYN